jgi:hypothetical protein
MIEAPLGGASGQECLCRSVHREDGEGLRAADEEEARTYLAQPQPVVLAKSAIVL